MQSAEVVGVVGEGTITTTGSGARVVEVVEVVEVLVVVECGRLGAESQSVTHQATRPAIATTITAAATANRVDHFTAAPPRCGRPAPGPS